MPHRPLSPHLFVYRFAYTMVTSILHRIAGLWLSVGLIVLVWWLMALAGGQAGYGHFTATAGHGLFKLLLALWLFAFLYHLANGIRHLCWDMGRGLERAQARRSAAVVIAAALLAGLILGWAFFFRGGA